MRKRLFHFQGGAGNQLFQLHWILSTNHNIDTVICLHRAEIQESVISLGLNMEKLFESGIRFINDCGLIERVVDALSLTAKNRVKSKRFVDFVKVLLATNLGDECQIGSCRRQFGYFQNYELQDETVKFMRTLFQRDRKTPKHAVVVHFRGAGFLGNNLGTLSPDYYRASIQLIRREIAPKSLTFHLVVMESDLPLARKVFQQTHADFIHTPSNFIGDFELLMSSNAIVLSNSTYAFWAAVLSENVKLVIAPEPSFYAHPSLPYLSSWKKIKSSFLDSNGSTMRQM